MGVARNTGLPGYVKDTGEIVHAARITGMETDPHTGYTVMSFGEIDKQTVATPKWIGEEQPQIGGYFVVSELGLRTVGIFMSEYAFNRDYAPEAQIG